MKKEVVSNQTQIPKLPISYFYLLPAIGLTTILYVSVYLYRVSEGAFTKFVFQSLFLILLGIYLVKCFSYVLMRNDTIRMFEGYSVDYGDRKRLYITLFYGIIFQIVATILLLLQLVSAYQIYIDVLFFLFLNIEFFRGFNARFQTKFLIRIVNEILEENY